MEIELYSKINNPVEAIERIGQFLAKSGMFGCEKVEQGQVLAMECLATGKPPSVIARTYHILDNKLSKKALAALAEFRQMGGKHKWVKDGTDGKEAVLELALEGNTITSKFTIEEAKAQGLIRPKSNWEKTPANMLRARAISNGVAMLAPEIYAGDSSDEDIQPAASSEPLLKKQKVEAKQEPAAPVIDVSPTQQPPQDAPTNPVVNKAAAPFSINDIALTERGKLTAESVKGIAESIGEENIEAAIAWLKARHPQPWIQTGLSDLSVDRAKKIMKNPAGFIQHIKGTK
ncbi:MAG TPA: hypothetical protein VEH04_08220 [Verrucomicrobiae bacterium]|nr:hypothetical protein [Verrucomicrobiae bacterium]